MAFIENNAFNHAYISPQKPMIMLSTKSHEILGFITNFDIDSISINYNMNSANEISFDVYKEVDGVEEKLWDSIIDFKYIYYRQPDEDGGNLYEEYFNIEVTVDDGDDTVKHITGTSACEFELSKRMLYGFEINTETDYKAQEYDGDIAPGADYIPTKFYDSENPKFSLLHRILNDENAALGDYHLEYVSPSLCNIQRKFTADGKDVYSFLTGDIAKEIECLFAFDSVDRGIYVYDLKYVCDDCGTRGEPAAVCPNPDCRSTHYHTVFGENTDIYVSAENYAEQISRSGKTDEVFNCLRISGGDEIINTALCYVNPNGTRYVFSFSEDMLNDMPSALRTKIEQYNAKYAELQPAYQAKSEEYYNAVDEKYYREHSMMPDVTTPTTSAQEQADKLPTEFEKFGNVVVSDLALLSRTSANLAVQGLAGVVVDSRYKVTANGSLGDYDESLDFRTWNGTVKIENYGKEDDVATTAAFTVLINDNGESYDAYTNYLKQRILRKIDRDDGIFFNIFEIEDDDDFKEELTKYSLASLKGFYQAYDTVVSVLTEEGAGDPNYRFHETELIPWETIYSPYEARQNFVAEEMQRRESQLYGIEDGILGDEDNPKRYDYLGQESTVYKLNRLNDDLAGYWSQLNFAEFLGPELFNAYSHYRMESTYTNSNYVSTGSKTTQLLKDAKELFDVGLKEAEKASQIQYTLTCNLNDLLLDEYESEIIDNIWSYKRFKPFKNKFQLGNWINLRSDEKVFHLRLLSMSVDFGSLDHINVTFSDALQVNGIISDAKSVLDSAKSMASSYGGVAHQASQGESANRNVEDWLTNGLNAALTTLKNSTNEEMTFDNNGILGRSYDDITDTYNAKQVKITSRVIAFTNDNWTTAKLALGESLFSRYDDNNDRFITERGYGLLAEYLNGSYITGSQIVGGDLYSLNYSATNHVGSHIDLNTGYFSLGGGDIKYDQHGLSISIGGKSVGDAIDTVTIEYAKNTDKDNPPTDPNAWKSTQPARSEGEQLWQRTTITFLSGKTPEVTVVNITGIDGKDGEKGADGRGIRQTSIFYASWDSGTTYPLASSDRWKNTISATGWPSDSAYPYLWTKTIITYTDSEQSISYSVSKNGQDGAAGKTGTSVSSITTQYAIRYTADSSSGYYVSWSDYVPDYDQNCYNGGYYYWTRDKTYYDNSSTPTYSTPVVNYGLTTANRIAYEAESGVNALDETYVLKVKNPSSGSIAAVKLSASASGASEFKVGASSIYLTADETIDFLSGGTINMKSKSISITSDNFSVTPIGKITAKLGTIGGWNIDNHSIYSSATGGSSGSGSYSIAGYGTYPWTRISTLSGYPLWASSTAGTQTSGTGEYANTQSSCRITLTGYSKFTIMCLSNGEGTWDYLCVSVLDETNMTPGGSTSSTVYRSFGNSENTQRAQSETDSKDYTNTSIYTPIEFNITDGGTHTIDLIYVKDGSRCWGLDRAFFYVDESQCTAYSSGPSDSDFVLSVNDFNRLIGDQRRYNLRMAVGNNFAVSNNGTLYANGGVFRGEITATSGKVGGWDIGTNYLKSTSAYLQITASGDSNTYIRLQNTSNQARIVFSGTDAWIYARTSSDNNMVGMMNFQADNSTSGRIFIPASTTLELKKVNVLRVTQSFTGNRLLYLDSTGGYLTESSINVNNIGTVKTGTIDTTVKLTSGSTIAVGSIYLDVGTWVVFAKAQMSGNVGDQKVLQAGIGSSGASNSLSESTSQGNKVNVVNIITSTGSTYYLNMNQNTGNSTDYKASSESWIKAVRIK